MKQNNQQRPTPETDQAWAKWPYAGPGVHANFARKLERERDDAREQIASCAINTNVRLFDLVRYMRSELHQASLITDAEYSWLCNGCEMANSPQGGSPSPRRLEDYKMLACQSKRNAELQKQLEATKAYAERCKQDCINLSFAIDRIDYVCGEPNEMEVSDYALHQDEKHVVERVKEQLAALREAIREAHRALTDVELRGREFEEGHCPYALASYLQSIADRALKKLQPFLKP